MNSLNDNPLMNSVANANRSPLVNAAPSQIPNIKAPNANRIITMYNTSGKQGMNPMVNSYSNPELTTEKIIEYIRKSIKDHFGERILNETKSQNFELEFRNYIEKELNGVSEVNSPDLKNYIISTLVNDILGLGVIQPLIDDPSISEIEVKRYDDIYVEIKGKLTKTTIRFASEQKLRDTIEKIVQPIGKNINESSPIVDARLADGSRVCATIPPIAPDGAILSIRKFAKEKITADDYVNKYHSATQEMLDFLKMCVIAGTNIMISGGTGTGKTSALNLLSNFIPDGESVITIEDTCELQLQQSNVRRLEARQASVEGSGEVTIRDLVKTSLRLRPDRIVVGEVRDGVVVDLFRAMSSGHEGSISTVHSNSPTDLINSTLPILFGMSDMNMNENTQKHLTTSALDLIVQLEKSKLTGERKITHISYVCGMGREGALIAESKDKIIEDKIYLRDIFFYNKITKRFEFTNFIPTILSEKFRESGITINLKN